MAACSVTPFDGVRRGRSRWVGFKSLAALFAVGMYSKRPRRQTQRTGCKKGPTNGSERHVGPLGQPGCRNDNPWAPSWRLISVNEVCPKFLMLMSSASVRMDSSPRFPMPRR